MPPLLKHPRSIPARANRWAPDLPTSCGGTAPASSYGPCTRSSKFVSQLFELVSVTLLHVPVQLVVIVTSAPRATVCVTVGWPAHETVTVLEPLPPLKARKLISRRGVMEVNVALVTLGPLKPMFLVVNRPHGAEWYHWPLVPQSITLVGYCPVMT